MRKTKIICTLGPACDDYDKLKALALAGMNCARLNFSHGTHEEQLVRMNRVRKLREDLGIPLPILLDTKGPEIRFRDFENGFIELEKGDIFTLSHDRNLLGNKQIGGLSFSELAKSAISAISEKGDITIDAYQSKGYLKNTSGKINASFDIAWYKTASIRAINLVIFNENVFI